MCRGVAKGLLQPPRSGGLKERIESAVCECTREVLREIGGQVIWAQRLAALKSLHASSHRGLCTIHRAIAAAGDAKAARGVFGEAIRLAKGLG